MVYLVFKTRVESELLASCTEHLPGFFHLKGGCCTSLYYLINSVASNYDSFSRLCNSLPSIVNASLVVIICVVLRHFFNFSV